MRVSVILAHPYEKSFNHAIYQTVLNAYDRAGIQVFAHDLYRDGFDPVLTKGELGKLPTGDSLVEQYGKELLESDILVFIHPNWWGQPPAILKGYIDRVIRPPHAYDFPENDSGGGLPIGKLKGKIGIVFNTSNTPEERENTYFNDPLEHIWIKCIFGFCGIDRHYRKMFRVVADSSLEDRKKWLSEVQEVIMRTFEE
jgi:putative NADPH-quinone reductase